MGAGAARLKHLADRLGRKAQRNGTLLHEIIDGFLFRAVPSGANTIVYVIPSSRFLGASWWGSVTDSGVAAFINLDLPDATARISQGYTGGAYTAGSLGFYGVDGPVVEVGAGDAFQRRYGRFMEGPLSVCRSALLTGVQAQLFDEETRVGFACQVIRMSAITKLETEAPVGIPVASLTASLAPYDAGAGRVRLIELTDASLGIPDVGFDVQRFSGQPLEVGPTDGLVCMTAWFDDSPTAATFDRRAVFARYRLVPPGDLDLPTPTLNAEVVWSTQITMQDVPVDATEVNMFEPQTWGMWSQIAVQPPAEGENPVVIAMLMGFYARPEDDPENPLGASADMIHTYFLRINRETGVIDQSLVEAFDTWQLNHTDLLYRERTPVAMYSVGGSPRLFCAVRTTTYFLDTEPVVRKRIPSDASFTRLEELEHSIFNEFGVETPVDTGAYYIAYAAKFLNPVIGGDLNTGRRFFGGYHTLHEDTGLGNSVLFGEYWPVAQNGLGGSPLYRAVCEYAPNVLVAVVSPNTQYLDATQDRYLALIDGTTGELIQVSDAPIMPTKYDFVVPFQVSCYELGEYDFDESVMVRHAALIITIGVAGVTGGVFTTHDFGTTMVPLVDSNTLRVLNVHYLGSNISPARLGSTTGSIGVKPATLVP